MCESTRRPAWPGGRDRPVQPAEPMPSNALKGPAALGASLVSSGSASVPRCDVASFATRFRNYHNLASWPLPARLLGLKPGSADGYLAMPLRLVGLVHEYQFPK